MKRYDNIQILRVLSCLGVFVTHLAPRMGAAGWAASAANFCASGVYLFFLISGFLACAGCKRQPEWSLRSILAYYCRRLFRILPLYYAVILYNMALHGLLLRDVPPDPDGLYWLRYFFLTNAFWPGPDNFWSNLSATWTISLFVFFYLCAPFLVRLVGGGRNGGKDRDWKRQEKAEKSGVLRAAALYLAALLLRYVWVAAGLSSYMMVFYYLHFFVLGILVWELAALHRPKRTAAGFGIAAGLLGSLLQLSGLGNDYFTVISWGFAVIVLLTTDYTIKGCRSIARLLAVLDVHSYAIYLVHAVVIDGIVLLQAHIALPGAAVLFLAVVLTALGAFLAHRLIEIPAEKLCGRLVEKFRM